MAARGGKRAGSGRPAFAPTDEQRLLAKELSGHGVPHEQIAACIGIALQTMYNHLSAELDLGKAEANAQVGKSLFQKAVAGDVTAAIWWTKTQMGWKETKTLEHTGPDGKPIEFKEIRFRVVDPKPRS